MEIEGVNEPYVIESEAMLNGRSVWDVVGGVVNFSKLVVLGKTATMAGRFPAVVIDNGTGYVRDNLVTMFLKALQNK